MASLIGGLGGSAGFGEESMPRNDDSPSIPIDLTSVFGLTGLNFFGATYTGLFLNYNGSISFSSGITSFSPTTISGNTSVPIIAPFWADVDIRNTTDPSPGTNLIWWDLDVANKTFTATWDDVGYYSQHNDKTNAFQLRLVGKDTPGDFDIYFYYESINWLTGDASGGTGGMGGNMARAGYSSGNGKNFKEITESGTAAMANLESLGNAGAGIFLFEVRNGVVPLFTSAGDTVDFNNLTEEQKASIAANNDVYHGKGGSDTVVLPDPANYDQVVGKDKDNNDITLNWESSTTFFTESRAGDTYLVAARAGNHVIVAGAGNDAVTIDGNGNNTITAGSGSTSVVMISGGGNNTIVGGTGKANIDIDTTGTGINLVAGSDGKTSIKVKRIGSGLDEITTGAGETTIVMDRTDASGSSSIKTGAAKSEITITSGRGRNTIEAGAGELSVAIKATGGNENNTILLGAGQAKVTFTGVPTVHDFGIQQVLAGSGQAAVTFEGTFLNSSVKGGLVNTSPATFTDITVKDSTATLYLHGGLTIDALRLDKDAKVAVLDSGVVKISHVASDDGLTLNAGTIDVGAFATLELTNEFYGKVNLGSGSSTLILNQPVGFGFTAKTGTSQTLEFQLGNLITGDKIVLKGINQSSPIFSASLGDHKLADGTTQFILQLAGLGDIAVGSINGGMGFSNNAYFDVALSANKQDTVLTLKEGNNFDAALLGPQARSTHGVSGTGIKIGIISDSFANNRAGLTRDLTYGVIPGVNVLSDALDGYVFSGGLDEGRTMAGIVHAIAPHATLYFHAATNAFNFDDAINALRAAKVDIIVDDLGFGRPAEYLSSMNSVINSAVRSGITFVTAAGNDRPSLPIYGHSANPNVVAVAAMNVLATPTLAAPGGHYLPADTETFSSLGTNGKPDVTGVDAGQTSFPLGVNGLSPFYGTSAAAPSVAAVVALMMDANPLLRALPKEVARILEATALAFGTASDAGAGLVQAERAVAMAITHRENFFDATGNPVQGASLAVPDGLSATPLQPVSAALSVPVGNAGTGVTVMMLVEMGQAVTVSGLPSFTLNSGGLFTYDADHSSLGHGRLMFNYTVSGPDQAPLLAITGFSGTIEDLSGNDADFSALFGKATGLTVNSPLTVTSIASSQVGVVQAGQTIELTITLNHGATLVSAGGLPSLTLNVGAIATFDAASSNLAAGKLVFDYTVAAGQATPSLTIASVDLPGGSTIKDVNGNNADFALAIDQNMGVQIGPAFVAAVLPQVEQTAIGSGQTVEVIIAVSQGVVVDISKGAPTLTLGNGAIATYDAATSDPSKGLLVFDYKVGAGDQAASNLLVGTVALNGATIRDWSGLDVDLSGSQNTPTGLTIGSPLTVASTAPSKTGVLNLGESVQITLTMSGGLQAFDANAGGLSTFTLSGGGTAFYDPAASDPGAGKLVFAYTVVGSDQSIANLAITQFNQNGGIYFDGKGNFADFSGALNVPLGLQVVVPDPATVTIAAASAVKAEGNGGTTAFTFNVTLSKALGTTATMSWSVTGGDGNSVGTTDFVGGTMPGDTLSFAAGETVKTVTVAIQGDTTAEADEIFTVTLSHATGSVVLGTPSATGTIQNDEATVAIAASSASKAEGNAGSTAFTFTLTRGGDTSASQSVAWSVAGSGANPASAADFAGGISPSGSATFAAGETSRIITIAVQGDTAGEANEGFAVTLSNPSPGLTVTTASAAGTIQKQARGQCRIDRVHLHPDAQRRHLGVAERGLGGRRLRCRARQCRRLRRRRAVHGQRYLRRQRDRQGHHDRGPGRHDRRRQRRLHGDPVQSVARPLHRHRQRLRHDPERRYGGLDRRRRCQQGRRQRRHDRLHLHRDAKRRHLAGAERGVVGGRIGRQPGQRRRFRRRRGAHRQPHLRHRRDRQDRHGQRPGRHDRRGQRGFHRHPGQRLGRSRHRHRQRHRHHPGRRHLGVDCRHEREQARGKQRDDRLHLHRDAQRQHRRRRPERLLGGRRLGREPRRRRRLRGRRAADGQPRLRRRRDREDRHRQRPGRHRERARRDLRRNPLQRLRRPRHRRRERHRHHPERRCRPAGRPRRCLRCPARQHHRRERRQRRAVQRRRQRPHRLARDRTGVRQPAARRQRRLHLHPAVQLLRRRQLHLSGQLGRRLGRRPGRAVRRADRHLAHLDHPRPARALPRAADRGDLRRLLRPRRRCRRLRLLGRRVRRRPAHPGPRRPVLQHRLLVRHQRRGPGPLSLPRQPVRRQQRPDHRLPRQRLQQPLQPLLRRRRPRLLDRRDPQRPGQRPVRRLRPGQHHERRPGHRRGQRHHHPDGQGRRQHRLRERAARARHAMGRRRRHRRRHQPARRRDLDPAIHPHRHQDRRNPDRKPRLRGRRPRPALLGARDLVERSRPSLVILSGAKDLVVTSSQASALRAITSR